MKNFAFAFCLSLLITSCNKETAIQREVQAYLDDYNATFTELVTSVSEAQWKLNTVIREGDSLTGKLADEANLAYSEFTGSTANSEKVTAWLKQSEQLTDLQVRQLRKILYLAGNNPESQKEKVKLRISAETAQTRSLFGYDFKLSGKSVSTNQIDSILSHSDNLQDRLVAWQTSKEVGRVLKQGLSTLQSLRNETVNGLGYTDFFSYQVSDYGMTSEEMMELNQQVIREIWPLYRELHTWARYELAKKYKSATVPDEIPAHWIPNRWGQDWTALVDVEGLNLDSILANKSPEWIMKKGEEFYTSIGFQKLPASFWEKSDLYPLPAGTNYRKNNHASAWHIDLNHDVRSLMSVESNADWYETVNHELGHIYYYLSYTNPDVPPLLREGANRAYHEAIGTQIGMAAMMKSFLASNGLLPANSQTDETRTLLKQALNYVVFIPWSAGVMTEFEHDLYANKLPAEQYNKRWWELVKKYQGIVPPSPRGEEFCDAASKTHINDDAAQYYDYALSNVILFQLHEHIATNILKQDPRNCNYYGNKAVGDFLKSIMIPGSGKDWREVLKDKTGSDLSAKAMVNYFAPLLDYLKKENTGRKYTL
ncbi:MAG: M2 family metallopeptidase [Bacteroidetes bacterium]|nr:M2 family metallopeptidase [Bacteroidota bacterium]